MSTDTNKVKEKNKGAEISAEEAEILGMQAPKGFINMGVNNALLYRPEECKLAPIQGWMMDVRAFDSKIPGQDEFTMLAIELTKPTFALADGKGSEARIARPGEIVILTLVYSIANCAQYAMNPTRQVEVYIKPLAKVEMKNRPGQKVWRWDGPHFNPATREKLSSSFVLPESVADLPAQLAN